MLSTKIKITGLPGVYCPVGAEGYDNLGELIIPLASTGWVTNTSGQVVFKTAQTYNHVGFAARPYTLLLVAGGGQGGSGNAYAAGGGGGGAGGLLYVLNQFLTGSKNIIVGTGGDGITGRFPGASGNNSKIDNMEAIGGGGGGCENATAYNGGSGGGQSAFTTTVATGVTGQGKNGGIYAGSAEDGAGGGGAGAVGSNANAPGNGGAGLEYFGTYYAGGGGGGTYGASGKVGKGGIGGGGDGHYNTGNGKPGTNYLGGGGGGSGSWTTGGTGGKGGDGLIIIRWGDYSHNYNPIS